MAQTNLSMANGLPIRIRGAGVNMAGDNNSNNSGVEGSPRPASFVTGLTPGAYKVWPADCDGECVDLEFVLDANGRKSKELAHAPDPTDHKAVEIYFGMLNAATEPPKDQLDLQDAIDQVLQTVRTIYLPENGEQGAKFRLYYVRLFRIAQLGLEGNALPDVAKTALERVVDDLIRSEGPRVKNLHLRSLAIAGSLLTVVPLSIYIGLRLGALAGTLPQLGIDAQVTAAFMMIWIGSFVGVWLSYALRKAVLKLRDLIVSDEDYLWPTTRLVFAGLLSNIIGMMLFYDVIKVAIGPLLLNDFAQNPSIALLLGMVLGINELLLPSTVTNKTRDLLDKL